MTEKRIGKFVLIEKIGEGAMGEVHKARDPVLNRYVAIKTITESRDADPEFRRRFLREAQSVAQLSHPNIITVFDMGEEQGKVFMCMELLDGVDLKDLIRSKKLTLLQKLHVMEQVCDGLAFAHSKEIVHRDLKPGNIHIQSGGQVKVMDFGLARLASSDITRTGLVMGTPDYMSPEQVQGQKVDVRSDVFSLGAVFYELFTERKPFHAETIHATMFKVVQGDREPLDKLVPDLPPELKELIDKSLASDPDGRYQNAGEQRDVLRDLRRELEPGSESDIAVPTDLLETVIAESSPAREPASKRPRSVSASSSSSSSSGRVASRGTLRKKPTTAAASRSPKLLIVGAAVGLLVFLGVFILWPKGKSEVETPGVSESVDPLDPVKTVEDDMSRALDLARQSLEARDYSGAVAHAEVILEAAPDHAEALEIHQQAAATLDEIETAIREARILLDSGSSERAAQKLAIVFSLDPSHPVAKELSEKMEGQFRGRANQALEAMKRERESSRRAGADSVSAFERAEQTAREGEAELGRGEYAAAYRKFTLANNGYAQARRAAEKEAESRARAALQIVVAQWDQMKAQAPSDEVRKQSAYQSAISLESQARQMAERGDLESSSRAYNDAMSQLRAAEDQAAGEKRAREAEKAEAARLRAAESFPTPPPQSVPATTSVPEGVVDEQSIRRVIALWEQAIETQDLALYHSAKPNLTAEDESRLKASFEAVESQQVDITITSLDVRGDRAAVRLARRDVIVARGQRHESAVEQSLVLGKQGDGWIIMEIGQE